MTSVERIAQLERRVRWQGMALFVTIAVFGASVLMGQAPEQELPESISVRKVQADTLIADAVVAGFVVGESVHVVDDEGRSTIALYPQDGAGAIAISDGHSEVGQVFLGLTEHGDGVIATYSATGEEILLLGVSEDGDGTITTYAADGRALVNLGVTEGGSGRISTFGTDGLNLVSVGATADGAGSITTHSVEGHDLVSVSAGTRGAGMVVVFDSAGRDLLAIGAAADGEGVVATFSEGGELTARWP